MSLTIFLSGNKVNLCLLDSDVDLSEYLDKLLNARRTPCKVT